MIDNVNSNLTKIKGYLDEHEKLLNKENTLLRDIGYTEEQEKNRLKTQLQEFSKKFLEHVDSGISEIVEVSETIQEQFSQLSKLANEIRSFDRVERQMIRGELITAKNALKGVKFILDEDRHPFSSLVKDLDAIYSEYKTKFEHYGEEIRE